MRPDSVTKTTMNLTARLQELTTQLEQLGYSPSQQKAIIYEAIGNVPLQSLTKKQEVDLINALDEYVRFGLKCRLTVDGSDQMAN